MSGWRASCPSCGGEILFNLGSSLLKVCENCGSAVVRKGADVTAYGKVAELIPTPSVLALDMSGGWEGAGAFRLVGRLQLDWGAGTWDEWLMGFDNGNWAWLAETQGRFYYMARQEMPPAPAFSALRVGQTVDLGPPGTFVVSEVRSAKFASARGELPFDVEPGALLNYADLSGPRGQFATLDYGEGDSLETLYVGYEVSLGDIGIQVIVSDDERRKKDAAKNLSCKQCGGPLELRAPDLTQRVACPWCGSLLDATKDLAVLEVASQADFQPMIPLGAKGLFEDVTWTLIGAMERSVTYEGERYPWREYLLYDPRNGFRWLTEYRGHWSFVENINPGDVDANGTSSARYEGQSYRHFQGAAAVVDFVVGEFYWAVARGETVNYDDYVAPPYVLSCERGEQEVTWSRGTYKTPDEVWRAFSLPGTPPQPTGIAPSQPSPWAGKPGRAWLTALLALGALLFFFVALSVTGGKTALSSDFRIPVDVAPGAPEAVVFSDPFDITSRGNLEVKLEAPVSNSWLYVDGALINDATGDVDEFDLEASYYSGRDSDGSWSEGGRVAYAYVSSVPPGRYVMRLAPLWENGKKPAQFSVTARSRVPRVWMMVLIGILLLIPPIWVSMRSGGFETRRWSESDHTE